MKHSRKIIAFLMILILVWSNFFIVILNAHLNSFEDISDEDMERFMSQSLVEIYVIPETLSHQHMYVKVINNFNYDFIYGQYMRLYVRHWNRWRHVEHGVFVVITGITLPANSYVIEFVDLRRIFRNLESSGYSFGTLRNGEYRLVRTFSLCFDSGSVFQAAGAFTLSG